MRQFDLLQIFDKILIWFLLSPQDIDNWYHAIICDDGKLQNDKTEGEKGRRKMW